MAVHLEFIVPGPPIFNQQKTKKGKANLLAWRAKVSGEAQSEWAAKATMTDDLKAIVINFFSGKQPSVDVDNMSKPIFDVLQNVVYENDRSIVQAELVHVELGAPFSVKGVSLKLLTAFSAGQQFVYVRIEDPVVPYPLPG